MWSYNAIRDILVLKQAYAIGVFGVIAGGFLGAWRDGRTLRVGWWRFGLLVLYRGELSGAGRGGGPEHPYSGFKDDSLTTQRQTQLIEQSKEHRLPRVPRQ